MRSFLFSGVLTAIFIVAVGKSLGEIAVAMQMSEALLRALVSLGVAFGFAFGVACYLALEILFAILAIHRT